MASHSSASVPPHGTHAALGALGLHAASGESDDHGAMFALAGDYRPEAFEFVRSGLAHTVDRVALHASSAAGLGTSIGSGDSRHVSGQQLCLGLRELAIERYGLLAPTVLRHWNVRRTEDFGRIVYAMIEFGLLAKTHEDSIEHFSGVYDFDEAFSPSACLRPSHR